MLPLTNLAVSWRVLKVHLFSLCFQKKLVIYSYINTSIILYSNSIFHLQCAEYEKINSEMPYVYYPVNILICTVQILPNFINHFAWKRQLHIYWVPKICHSAVLVSCVQPFEMHKSAHVLVNMYTLWQQQQWQWISSNTYLTAKGAACRQNHSENGTATIMLCALFSYWFLTFNAQSNAKDTPQHLQHVAH